MIGNKDEEVIPAKDRRVYKPKKRKDRPKVITKEK